MAIDPDEYRQRLFRQAMAQRSQPKEPEPPKRTAADALAIIEQLRNDMVAEQAKPPIIKEVEVIRRVVEIKEVEVIKEVIKEVEVEVIKEVFSTQTSQLDSGLAAGRANEPAPGAAGDPFGPPLSFPPPEPIETKVHSRDGFGRIQQIVIHSNRGPFLLTVARRNDLGGVEEVRMIPFEPPSREIHRPNWGTQ